MTPELLEGIGVVPADLTILSPAEPLKKKKQIKLLMTKTTYPGGKSIQALCQAILRTSLTTIVAQPNSQVSPR